MGLQFRPILAGVEKSDTSDRQNNTTGGVTFSTPASYQAETQVLLIQFVQSLQGVLVVLGGAPSLLGNLARRVGEQLVEVLKRLQLVFDVCINLSFLFYSSINDIGLRWPRRVIANIPFLIDFS